MLPGFIFEACSFKLTISKTDLSLIYCAKEFFFSFGYRMDGFSFYTLSSLLTSRGAVRVIF